MVQPGVNLNQMPQSRIAFLEWRSQARNLRLDHEVIPNQYQLRISARRNSTAAAHPMAERTGNGICGMRSWPPHHCPAALIV